jgi:hypothetical protein
MAIHADNLFILDTEELALIQSKSTVDNHLAFAVMLKFFQLEGRYPTQADGLSETMIGSLSVQLNCSHANLSNYNWMSRTAKRFRQEIRILLNYKEATATDSDQLVQWLMEKVLPLSPTLSQCHEHALQFFREHRLESFSKKMVNRSIRAAMHRFEKQFFSCIFSQLSSDALKSIANLLHEDSGDADESEEDCYADVDIILRHLKKDVAGVKLKHVNFEIEKLRRIRRVNLSPQIFGAASRKLIQKYYTRIMAASPSNILEYVPETRYGLMASFCHIRSQLYPKRLEFRCFKLAQNHG